VAEIAVALALAGFAGFVRYIQRFAGKKDERPPWEWVVFSTCVFTGAFVGLLTLWLVPKETNPRYVLFAISLAGYGGPLTLEFFLQAAKEFAGKWANGPKS
jgi:LydA family holin superfamily III